jgi:hypothetical protein
MRRSPDLEANLVRHLDLDGAASVGLDPVELTAVALHPAHRYSPDLGAIEGLEHVVRALGPDDPDHKLHGLPLSAEKRQRQPLPARTYRKAGSDPNAPARRS